MKPRSRRWLGRIGGAAVVLVLVALASGATMAWPRPARAAGSDTVQLKMPGQTSFTSGSTQPLLDTAGLGPGGSVSGTMQVRDTSGETLGTDSVYLTMINVRLSDGCPVGGSACAGSGSALADALRFALEVSDPVTGAPIRHSSETVASLRRGALLGSKLSDGDVIRVRLTASLPFDSAGNEVQYGGLGFNLQLDLISVAGESDSIGNGGGGDGSSGSEPPGEGGLVIGGGQGDLASTGAPVRILINAATALLGLGMLLVLVARTSRRSTSRP